MPAPAAPSVASLAFSDQLSAAFCFSFCLHINHRKLKSVECAFYIQPLFQQTKENYHFDVKTFEDLE